MYFTVYCNLPSSQQVAWELALSLCLVIPNQVCIPGNMSLISYDEGINQSHQPEMNTSLQRNKGYR